MLKKLVALTLSASMILSITAYASDTKPNQEITDAVDNEEITVLEYDETTMEEVTEEVTEVDSDNSSEYFEEEISVSTDIVSRFIVKCASNTYLNAEENLELYSLEVLATIDDKNLVLVKFFDDIDLDNFIDFAELIFGNEGIDYIQPDYEMYLVDNELLTEEPEETESLSGDILLTTAYRSSIVSKEAYEGGEFVEPEQEFMTEADEIISDEETTYVAEEIGTETFDDSDAESFLEDEAVIETEIDQEEVLIAVIDGGINVEDVDIAESIFINDAESENEIDDDHNGYVDDTNGWNFVEGNNIVYTPENLSKYTHGTISAKNLLAEYDNAKILNLKAFEDGIAYTSNVIKAIYYANDKGVDIVTCTATFDEENTALVDVIDTLNVDFIGFEYEASVLSLETSSYLEISNIEIDYGNDEAIITTSYSAYPDDYIAIKLVNFLTGKTVYLNQFPAEDNAFTIDMSNNDGGIYIVYMKINGYRMVADTFIYASSCNFEFSQYGDTVLIKGSVMNADNRRVAIKIIDDTNHIKLVSQTKTNEIGEFTATFSNLHSYTGLVAFVTIEGIDELYVLENEEQKTARAEIAVSENPELYKAIRNARPELDSDETGVITSAELSCINGTLILSNANITSIDGLQYCTSVTTLYIDGNNISDISPVSGMENLKGLFAQNNCIGGLPELPETIEVLNLSGNFLTSVASIGNLTNLKSVYLDDNYISEISFINGTANLKYMSIKGNNLISIYSTSKATKLLHLDLSDNNISNITPLAELDALRDLRLSNNQITDISEISNLAYDYLYLDGNQIVYINTEDMPATNIVYDIE